VPVTVSGGQTASVDLTLQPDGGTLVLRTTPSGCRILIDGKEQPEKTPAELKLKPGSYQVTVINADGRRDISTITIRSGVPGILNVNFP